MTAQDERRLLADYDARVDHQKHYGRSMMGVRRADSSAWLEELGLDVDALSGLTDVQEPWYMSEIGGSKRHAERDCLGLRYTSDDEIRPSPKPRCCRCSPATGAAAASFFKLPSAPRGWCPAPVPSDPLWSVSFRLMRTPPSAGRA